VSKKKPKSARSPRSTKRAPKKTRAKAPPAEAAAAKEEAAREKDADQDLLDVETRRKAKELDRLMRGMTVSPFRRLLASALKPSTARNRDGGWRERFLEALAATCNVTVACKVAGVDRTTVYMHKEKDPEFDAAWQKALETAIELMEAEMHRRAFEGTLRPVFQGGELAGVVTEYSDTLAIFLAKAHRPEKYRERISVKDESPRRPINAAAVANAIAGFLGEVEQGTPGEGSGAGGQGPGAD
jgi:hypothetical protein